jgi:hypothetical protein
MLKAAFHDGKIALQVPVDLRVIYQAQAERGTKGASRLKVTWRM